jgi:hypothetical protein
MNLDGCFMRGFNFCFGKSGRQQAFRGVSDHEI